MKKLFLIMLMPVLFGSFMAPEGIKWYSLEEGLEIARRDNKPVLLFIYATWCDQCKRMDKKIFPSPEVIPIIQESYIPVKLNPETDTVYMHSDKYIERKLFMKPAGAGRYQLSVPTTLLYRVTDKEHFTIYGMVEPASLKSDLEKFLKK